MPNNKDPKEILVDIKNEKLLKRRLDGYLLLTYLPDFKELDPANNRLFFYDFYSSYSQDLFQLIKLTKDTHEKIKLYLKAGSINRNLWLYIEVKYVINPLTNGSVLSEETKEQCSRTYETLLDIIIVLGDIISSQKNGNHPNLLDLNMELSMIDIDTIKEIIEFIGMVACIPIHDYSNNYFFEKLDERYSRIVHSYDDFIVSKIPEGAGELKLPIYKLYNYLLSILGENHFNTCKQKAIHYYQEQLNVCDKIIEIDKEEEYRKTKLKGDVSYNLSLAYFDEGKQEEFVKYMEQAIKLYELLLDNSKMSLKDRKLNINDIITCLNELKNKTNGGDQVYKSKIEKYNLELKKIRPELRSPCSERLQIKTVIEVEKNRYSNNISDQTINEVSSDEADTEEDDDEIDEGRRKKQKVISKNESKFPKETAKKPGTDFFKYPIYSVVKKLNENLKSIPISNEDDIIKAFVKTMIENDLTPNDSDILCKQVAGLSEFIRETKFQKK